jgi:hypothetical protein
MSGLFKAAPTTSKRSVVRLDMTSVQPDERVRALTTNLTTAATGNLPS